MAEALGARAAVVKAVLVRVVLVCLVGAAARSSCCWAMVLEIPALGVRFANVPAETTEPMVAERPTGWEASFEIEDATVSVYREDAKVPAGSTIQDDRYVQSIRIPGFRPEEASRGSRTIIAGYPAWERQAEQSILPSLIYHRWTAYLIVDEHLYRLVVFSLARRATVVHFRTAKKAVSGIAFGPVVRPANRANDSSSVASGADRSRMPRFISAGVDDVYPPQAQRLGEEGDVDVGFDIDARGHVQNLREFYSSAPHLGGLIPRFLADGLFKVGPDWHASGADQRRYRMEFQFSLHCPAPKRTPVVPNTMAIAVCVNFGR